MTDWRRFDGVPIGGLSNGSYYLVYAAERHPPVAVARYFYDQYGYGGDNPSHHFSGVGDFASDDRVTHYAELPEAPDA